MKKVILSAIAIILFNSCQTDDVKSDTSFSMKSASADYVNYPYPVQTVSGTITTNTTWTNDKVWEIEGVLRVIGAKLTIQPGTYIKAKPLGVGIATGILVITKTAQIDAQGTINNPIIFTSYKLLDWNTSTSAAPAEFGGIVLLGDAPVNTQITTNLPEGLSDQSNLSDFYYGGSNAAHNAGILRYVRIEFGGRILSDGNEVNGLSCYGVGSGTIIDHVQVSYSSDDSFQFFGGNVNATHLVAFAQADDGFDFELGYTGSITKAISISDTGVLQSSNGGSPDSNGIELDSGLTTASPITRPVISQMSIIGASSPTGAALYENAIHIRNFGQITLSNTTVTGYLTGIRWQTPSLPASSSWLQLSVHAFNNPVLPVTSLGLGSASSTTNPATAWGLSQPFFNNGALDFTGSTGAFKTETNWTNTWTKFTNF